MLFVGVSTLKKCSCCHAEKERDLFFRDKKRKDGLYPVCKECHTAKRKAHYEANRERIIAQTVEYARNHPEAGRKKAAAYREKHPERVKESLAKYEAKPESKARYVRYRESGKGKAYKAQWKAANVERVRRQTVVSNMRRRARLLNNGIFVVTEKDMRRLLNANCVMCGAVGEHIDHIIPVSRGGRHSIGNLQTLCVFCNLSKNNKLPIEWRAYRASVAA